MSLLSQKLSSLSNAWDQVKAWFKYSETIFLARLATLGGFITALVGSLDLSPLSTVDYSTLFTKRQVIGIGAGILISGIVAEIARRRNANL